ncbi:MAG TPA: flagellar assembly protein FliX [Geminicoccaceae bacterium]|nr:flagellar assembly protein FliX [Geminicoccaceae bacterium]
MRVNGPGGPGVTSRQRDIGRAPGGPAFAATVAAAPAMPTSGPAGAAAAAALTTLDAILALQELPDAAERRRRAVRRGHCVLDRLEELRLALVEGSLSRPILERLQLELGRRERAADEPRLEGILDEIELRAAVELAKLEILGVADGG